MLLRKNVTSLTASEKSAYVNALLERKRTRPGKELLELRLAVVCWVC